MTPGFEHLCDHNAVKRRRDLFDILDHQARDTQAISNLLRGRIDLDELTQPAKRQLHRAPPLTEGNWDRRRRSFSKNRRMSSIPSANNPVRSTPIPKAKPPYSSGSRLTARSTLG